MSAAALAILWLAATGPAVVQEAEELAAKALAEPAGPRAIDDARRALSLTLELDPMAFVRAGRKGEVLEDSYVEAREAYRRHRARLYEAVGACLLERRRVPEAARYLGRAHDLDPTVGGARLIRAWTRQGRGQEALERVLRAGPADAPVLAAASEAVDAAGLPSLQVEIDRTRLERLQPRPAVVDGPLDLGDRLRLSSGAPFRMGEAPTILYVAEASCRSCSADLESLRRLLPAGFKLLLAAADPDRDTALRRALTVYNYDWPLLLGVRSGAWRDEAPRVHVVARNGFLAAVAAPPFASTLPPVFDILSRNDVAETVPRAGWNGRPALRRDPDPGYVPQVGELVRGEDEPVPREFTAADAAYREGKHREALIQLERLEERTDGWLLPPEARLNRALCLIGLGRRDEARKILLRIGDSRYQDHVDRVLESDGAPGKR